MSNFTVTPLGTVSPYPKGLMNCPGFLIEYENNNIMLDCGNGALRNIDINNKLNNLKIIITHLHEDHYGDLLSLIPTIYVYKRLGLIDKVPEIYIPQNDQIGVHDSYITDNGWGEKTIVEREITTFDYIMDIAKRYDVPVIPYTYLEKEFDYFKISSLIVPHGITSHAIKFETSDGDIVYSSDTGSQNKLRKFGENADLFICESTFLKGQLRIKDEHLYAYEAAMIARDANVKKLLLTHFWPEIEKQQYVDEAKEYFQNVEAAKEGIKVYVRR